MKLILPLIFSLSFFFFQLNANINSDTGGNVTLHVNTTGLQIKSYNWTFNKTELIISVKDKVVTIFNGTRFEGRLQTDVTTGSVTILNLSLNDSGTFTAHVVTNSKNISHFVHLVVKDSIYCMVGTNITLKSGLETMMGYVVHWAKGPNYPGTEIVNSQKCPEMCPSEHGDGFDKLVFNQSNGDLIINNIKNFSGIYYVRTWIYGWPHTMIIYDVRVYEPISVPSITTITAQPASNVCGATCSVENGPDVNLTWYKGDISISTISNQSSATLRLLLEIQPGDSSIYSCEAQNPVSVERRTLSSEGRSCYHSGMSALLVVLIVGVVVALILFTIITVNRPWQKRKRGNPIEDSQISQSTPETLPQNAALPVGSEEYLLRRFQGINYETENQASCQT